jgi:hypothetical protein
MALLLASCASPGSQLMKVPGDYSLEQAKADGCVVYEDGNISSGQEIWDTFAKKCESGKKASVRLGFYYTLSEKNISQELYEESKDKYPVLFIQDLSYNGKDYTLLQKDDNDPNVILPSKYRYMRRYAGSPENESATFSSYLYYVLVNDDTVTWEQIGQSIFSSRGGDWIPHQSVYQKLEYTQT